MSTNDVEHPDPEDMFNDTRMSFGDHLEDLRTHLIRAVKGFVIGMIIGIWPLGSYVLAIIVNPVESQLDAFERRKLDRDNIKARQRIENAELTMPRITVALKMHEADRQAFLTGQVAEPPVLEVMSIGFGKLLSDLEAQDLLTEENAKALGEPGRRRSSYYNFRAELADPMAVSDAMERVKLDVSGRRLATMNITEAFFVYFKIAMLTGLVVSSPWVFYQIWAFIAAGLYPHEKKLVHVYLPFSIFLFLAGVLICQFAVMPRAVEAMLWFNEWLGLDADLRLNEWLGFALMMPIVFGVSFQTPLVMMFIHRIGIVSVQTFREKRRIAWFVMAIFAAVITPSVDAFSMMFLWVPMGALYELGILLCAYQGEEAPSELDEEEKSTELVEV
jgi:sec-independent protein translocase protein TatC